MDIPISKRGIPLESLCRTSQNKCYAHLFFIQLSCGCLYNCGRRIRLKTTT